MRFLSFYYVIVSVGCFSIEKYIKYWGCFRNRNITNRTLLIDVSKIRNRNNLLKNVCHCHSSKLTLFPLVIWQKDISTFAFLFFFFEIPVGMWNFIKIAMISLNTSFLERYLSHSKKYDFRFLSNWKEYDRIDSFPFELVAKLNSTWFQIKIRNCQCDHIHFKLKETENTCLSRDYKRVAVLYDFIQVQSCLDKYILRVYLEDCWQ